MSEYVPLLSGEGRRDEPQADDDRIFRDREGGYRLRHNVGAPGVAIPKRLALLMRLGLAAEDERLWRDRVDAALQAVNCHKTVLYVLGRISKRQLLEPPGGSSSDWEWSFHYTLDARRLSNKLFVACLGASEVEDLAEAECGVGEWCVGQIASRDGRLLHSFILAIDRPAKRVSRVPGLSLSAHARFMVFETVGFEAQPTQLATLRALVESADGDDPGFKQPYADALWRFFKPDELGPTRAALAAAARLD